MVWPTGNTLWTVPPVWRDSTIVCLGCGPSLAEADLDLVHQSEARVIAINSSYQLAPWADVLYAGDARFWLWYNHAPEFTGTRVAMAWNGREGKFFRNYDQVDHRKVFYLASTGFYGLEEDPRGVREGKNSGYAAINLAVHLGASRVVLVGYDMRSRGSRHHWDAREVDERLLAPGDHAHLVNPPPFELFLPAFQSIIEPLEDLGVEVINCTTGSALDCFPHAELVEVV